MPTVDLVAGIPSQAIARIGERERARYLAAHPVCAAATHASAAHWLDGVPMHWMTDWGLPVPLVVKQASGSIVEDIDGHRYGDFCLGDTGAMFGHSPAPVAEAIRQQSSRGLTCMLPVEATARIGELLAAHFSLPCWQMTQTATDANRAVVRWARALTRRKRILVFEGCYHGSLEDTMVELSDGSVTPRRGQVGQVADFAALARVVEFNDLAGLEAALAWEDVACVLAEPVMTNAGMVLPQPGFWEQARALCDRYGTLLAIDETHTLSSGPGGYARRIGLRADFVVAGKAIAGGVPCAVYGFTTELAQAMSALLREKPSGHSGMGTTLAANALASAALAACLEHVMTEDAYRHMTDLSAQLVAGIENIIQRHALPWHVSNVGARSELCFSRMPALTARESLSAAVPVLERTLHLYLLNRGVLITPFHNMMLISPATEPAQVRALLDALDACCTELLS
ncbi:MAG TPA: transaminase [Povalibacter sp.]|uniref:transaminase n=1 Tax=Povalibacter sp. TaxID=1962978 RepID=UPI002D030B2C|nr:transaminase [Povalibacter sp.]HMN45418.1 transaminase [Povalibacter sp.]